MQTIRQWLEQVGLPQYAEAFERNAIDLEIAQDLVDHDLKDLGIDTLGHRKLLLRAIAKLNGAGVAAVPLASIQQLPSDRSMSAEGERRQLTVLFCDLVGYTELASRLDPELLRGIVRSYEDTCAAAITRFEGYVFQRLGDGIVAFFGYPLAHEGEAERAIRAGLEILEALSTLNVPDAGQLQVRIGIATGLVVVSSAEKGAVGETMNLAARLQAIAQPGSIVVSERVRRLAGTAFDYEDLGEKALKGIAKPTHAHRILGVSEAASRFEATHQEGLTSLVGRELELGLLLERWMLAQDSEGQVVLLSGEPGIGKSRILTALRERLEAQGAQTLRFQCSPYYVNSAFWPSIDYFERALKFARDESPDSKLDKLEELIVAHYGRPLDDVRFVASMLSIPYEARYGVVSMIPQKFKDETLRTLVDLTEAAARKQPSVMLFEDVHWADPTTLEVLDLLIDRTKDFPLLMVLTHRPEFQSRWSQHGHVTMLNLAKLTRAQSGAMVSKLTGGKALPSDLLEQVLTKTDGVPLFVEELTKSILESGELKELGDRYEYVGSARTISIPTTLRDSLMARLDRFTPMKEIAQIAAAIGREFSYELISAIAPIDPMRLDNALTQLTDSGLAFRRGTPPDATYTFKHALVQDAAYDSLLKSKRAQIHAQIAAAIEEKSPAKAEAEPELLAHHYTGAGMWEKAIPWWKKAAEVALARYALSGSIAHGNKGMALVAQMPHSPLRDNLELGLRVSLGMAWMRLGGWAASDVGRSLEPAWELAQALGRNDHTLRILFGIWAHRMNIGQVKDSLRWAERLVAEGETHNSDSMWTAGNWAISFAEFFHGNFTRSLHHAELILTGYESKKLRPIPELQNVDGKVNALSFKARALWCLGFPNQARRAAAESVTWAEHLGSPTNICFARLQAAWTSHLVRDPDEVELHTQAMARVAQEFGLVFYARVFAPIQTGLALAIRGKAAAAVLHLQSALRVFQDAGSELSVPVIRGALGEALGAIGKVNEGLEEVAQAIAQIERQGWEERQHYADILITKGSLLRLKHDRDGAEASYREAIDIARQQQAKSFELRATTALARLRQHASRREEGRKLLTAVYSWFTEGFDTQDLKDAKALLDELT